MAKYSPEVLCAAIEYSNSETGFVPALIEKDYYCSVILKARSLVQDPFNKSLLIEPYPVQCLSKTETYAEKLRAALTRTKPAIRDIFDLDYALRNQIINFDDKELQKLAKVKLIQPESLEINLTDGKKAILKSQLETQLRPVLKEDDYQQFDFEKAWNDLVKIGDGFN